MPLSPTLQAQATYPFVRLNHAVAERLERGLEVIDFGMGDPSEPTDPSILQALRDGVRERMGYPAAVGLPELREAIVGWVGRRFGVELDTDRHVIPTLGSKEAIFSFAQVVLDVPGGRDTVVVTEPGYPVPGRGAAFVGARVVELPLLEENGFLPALDDVSEALWRRAALVWLNSPNNPTGAVAPLAFLERLAALAREHGFVLAADEAYSELWFDEPPPSVLQLDDWTNVVAFNTLSKRSSMTGFRSGFVAGDPELIAALRQFRPNVGTAPQEFVQRASVVAWGDEAHVMRARESYARKRAILLDITSGSRPARCRRPGDDVRVGRGARGRDVGGARSEAARERHRRRARLVPRPSGEGYVRYALVPTESECARAATILEDVLRA